MPKFDAIAPEFTADPPLVAAGRGISAASEAELSIFGRARAAVSRATDAQLATGIGVVLFALAAWPLALTDVPPYQDLPNHLAAVTVITHPERYPEFVSNGFLKTNSALFTWLYFVAKVVGAAGAARLFALMVLAANALILPRFVLHFTNRKTLLVASFFIFPMVHNWFVSMGMLDFALGVPLSLLLMVLIDRQRKTPSVARGLVIAVTALSVWFAHVFALMVVLLLAAVHVVTDVTEGSRWRLQARERAGETVRLFLPLAPATVLMLVSLYQHMTEPVGRMTGYMSTGQLLPPWELCYNLWAEWFYGFTWLSISTFVIAVTLFIVAMIRRHEQPTFFSTKALALLATIYFFSPYITTNWFHVNSRFIPFLWMAALLRLPERLPRALLGLLALCGVLHSVGMGIDFVRLDHDRAKFTAGIPVVREGAKLLPLIFHSKGTSQNTRSLLHAWGFYVTEKETSAPLLFAHSRSFPVMYKEPPPIRFNHLVLEGFAPAMDRPEWMCDGLRSGGVVLADCNLAWRQEWRDFWNEATPYFDHVLMWDAREETLALVPSEYHLIFDQDKLKIYARQGRTIEYQTASVERTPGIHGADSTDARDTSYGTMYHP